LSKKPQDFGHGNPISPRVFLKIGFHRVIRIFNESNDPHSTGTLRADERIDFE